MVVFKFQMYQSLEVILVMEKLVLAILMLMEVPLPFAEGVLLTTGKLSSAVGPNSNFSDDGTGMN